MAVILATLLTVLLASDMTVLIDETDQVVESCGFVYITPMAPGERVQGMVQRPCAIFGDGFE